MKKLGIFIIIILLGVGGYVLFGKNQKHEQVNNFSGEFIQGNKENVQYEDLGENQNGMQEGVEEQNIEHGNIGEQNEGQNNEQENSQDSQNQENRDDTQDTNTAQEDVEQNQSTSVVKLLAPGGGKIYFSAFPDFGGTEDNVSTQKVRDFEKLIGRDIFWAAFSQNWGRGMEYPKSKINAIYRAGAVPLVRFMPRTNFTEGCSDQSFSLEKISAGNFDEALRAWARAAKQDGRMLLIDFAVEANGNWFPWSGVCHGNNPQTYKNAYRHIIDIFREEGANNITWFFHFEINTTLNKAWNFPKAYYPGDEYIDWVGFSAYGPQNEGEDYWETLSEMITQHSQEVKAVTHNKPLALMEFAVTDKNPNGSKVEWLKDAFETILKATPLRFSAINYWHENWEEEDGVYALLRVDSSPEALATFKSYAKNPKFLPVVKATNVQESETENNNKKQTENTKISCVYNQAYTENGEADSLDDILQHARGCYVLVDPFDMTASQLQKLPAIAKQNTLSCYMSIGTAEEWRDDFTSLKDFAIDDQWDEWEGEYFLNELSDEVVNIMKARITKMANDGCEFVEFDNMDWADENNIETYHLDIIREDSHNYARKLCTFAHTKGLQCMAKSTNFDDAIFDGLTVESYSNNKNWWADNELKGVLWRGDVGLVVHYDEQNCESAEQYYKSIYGDKLLFLCEKKGGNYVHN